MMILVTAALVAAAPAVSAGSVEHGPQHVAMARNGEHEQMKCCECCEDMASEHKGHADHSGHSGR
jgi:hypothetical protein